MYIANKYFELGSENIWSVFLPCLVLHCRVVVQFNIKESTDNVIKKYMIIKLLINLMLHCYFGINY